MSGVAAGEIVTWNERGKELFGDTGSTGLLTDLVKEMPGHDGPVGHVLWNSGQETWASLDCLMATGASS